MTVDPYAAAKAQVDAQKSAAPAPTGQSVTAGYDMSDGFATADEFGGGGDFTPGPRIQNLLDRLCVLLPVKTFQVPNQQDPSKMDDIWLANLYVLTGGPFSYKYDKQIKDDAGNVTGKEKAVWQVENAVTPEDPFMVTNWRVYAKYVNYKLTNLVSKGPNPITGKFRPFLGVVKRIPGPQSKKGATIESIEADFKIHYADPANEEPPKFAWDMVPPTDEQMALAVKFGTLHLNK